jgi:hypothetical protein
VVSTIESEIAMARWAALGAASYIGIRYSDGYIGCTGCTNSIPPLYRNERKDNKINHEVRSRSKRRT